jgi:hypothetical protein
VWYVDALIDFNGLRGAEALRCYHPSMSLSHEWSTWHQTPRGWEPGSERMDFSQRVDRPIPPDGVLMITNDEHVRLQRRARRPLLG